MLNSTELVKCLVDRHYGLPDSNDRYGSCAVVGNSGILMKTENGKSMDEWGSAHDAVEFHYSSSMQAIMLALGICEKVSIFGFGKSAEATHHYYAKQKVELDLHEYAAE
ncbi:hypothetical protein NE237_018057 [Protea cynaroides]|uniref:Uncharacterized protein n=1 Tax=Protea cynaroides TaxID=273540 RepID=A0A9Q0QNN0_9MAGN|nr:hypothetical protein NE237_018057 [Protea cynaroides]